jgi:hypothetical protein
MTERIVKWEKVKNNVKARIEFQRFNGFPNTRDFLALLPAIKLGRDYKALLDEWYDKAIQIVDSWDVRMAKKLIELFPDCVRGKFTSIAVDMDENLDWILILS